MCLPDGKKQREATLFCPSGNVTLYTTCAEHSRFVIFGCVVLAFPILILLMFLRCMSEEEDLMEEAMFDLAEISIFCVFSVIEVNLSKCFILFNVKIFVSTYSASCFL